MTSVVDTSVKPFTSAMSGAPVVSGVAGAGVAWLDAVLVTGFDTKTLTSLVVAGGIATASFTGLHSAFVDSVVSIAGSSIAALNGEQKITAAGAGLVKFATAAADGAASGTITMKMAPAGWTKVFSGTNKAVYKSSDPASSAMFLRVDDTAAQVMRVVGYEAMSDVDTGTGPFPTGAQMSGGGYWAKSTAASSTGVAWHLVADSRTIYHAIQAGIVASANNQTAPVRGFGDAVPLRPSGDAYSAILSYSTNSTPAASVDGCLGNNAFVQIASPRAYTGLGSGVLQVSQVWGGGGFVTNYSGMTDVHGPFPNPIDGSLYLSKKMLVQIGSTNPRAELPGFYSLMQSGAWGTFKAGDKTPGSGALAGRTLMAMSCVGSSSGMTSAASVTNTGVVMIDITGPWR
jgi:hypothetical protein